MEPTSGGTFPTTLEGYLQVLLPAFVAQGEPQAGKHLMLVAGQRMKIPKEAGVGQNAEPAFTQDTKAAV
jgi:hypothetical protein